MNRIKSIDCHPKNRFSSGFAQIDKMIQKLRAHLDNVLPEKTVPNFHNQKEKFVDLYKNVQSLQAKCEMSKTFAGDMRKTCTDKKDIIKSWTEKEELFKNEFSPRNISRSKLILKNSESKKIEKPKEILKNCNLLKKKPMKEFTSFQNLKNAISNSNLVIFPNKIEKFFNEQVPRKSGIGKSNQNQTQMKDNSKRDFVVFLKTKIKSTDPVSGKSKTVTKFKKSSRAFSLLEIKELIGH